MTDEERQMRWVRQALFRSAVVISLGIGVVIGMLIFATGVNAWWVLAPMMAVGIWWMTRTEPPSREDD